jgi:hypothetical protein
MNNNCTRAKVSVCAIGAGAVMAMVALTVALSGTQAHAISAPLDNAGSTSTQTTPPPLPPTAKAAPPVMARKWTVGVFP